MFERAPRWVGFSVATLAVAASASAHADHAEAVTGRFAVKYAQVTSNCVGPRLKLHDGSMSVAATKTNGIEVTLDVEQLPALAGSARKGGRIKASSKLVSVAGMDGKFSIAGTIKSDGSLESMVFIAEYYDRGKAQCTQTWSVSGARDMAQSSSRPTPRTSPQPPDAEPLAP